MAGQRVADGGGPELGYGGKGGMAAEAGPDLAWVWIQPSTSLPILNVSSTGGASVQELLSPAVQLVVGRDLAQAAAGIDEDHGRSPGKNLVTGRHGQEGRAERAVSLIYEPGSMRLGDILRRDDHL